MSDAIDLPSVAGHMEMTHELFQRACQVELGRLQEDPNCDTRLVHLLCEAVRCSRECCQIATESTIDWKARAEKAEEELERVNKAFNPILLLLGETMDHVPGELRSRIVSAVAEAKAKGLL